MKHGIPKYINSKKSILRTQKTVYGLSIDISHFAVEVVATLNICGIYPITTFDLSKRALPEKCQPSYKKHDLVGFRITDVFNVFWNTLSDTAHR